MADLREELPYRTEYAKSGRASCKSCKDNIAKESLRMAVMVQSPFFDGKQPNWHHFKCFFTKYRPKVEEIAHFGSLKFEDQKKIEEAIKVSIGAPTGETSKAGTKKRTTKKKKAEEEAVVLSEMSPYIDFNVEYAKSNRAKCLLCDNTLTKGLVRIGKLDKESEDARRFGPLFRWFHVECFISGRESLGFYASAKQLPNFDKLEDSDQKDLVNKLKEIKKPDNGSDDKLKAESPKKKPKLNEGEEAVVMSEMSQYIDFNVEYAKSNRAKCRLCDNTLTKGLVRIGKLDRESEDARRFGPLFRWFHVECFISGRESLGFYASAKQLPNFDKLEDSDQKDLVNKLKEIKKPDNGSDDKLKAESPKKKPKLSDGEEKALKEQSDLLFKYIKFAENMRKSDLVQLMEYNKTEVPSANDSKYERLADAMAFGQLEKCPECKKGQLVFRSSGYICSGATKWATCEYQTTESPKRKEFKVPKDLAEEYEELNEYKYKKRNRIYNPTLKEAAIQRASASTSSAVLPKKESNGSTSSTVTPLNGYKILSFGKLKIKKIELRIRLKKLGATLVDSIDRTTLCIISSKKDVDKESAQILEAKELMVPIVSEEFLFGVENGSDPIQAISLNRLDNFEVDIEKRFNNLNVREKMKSAFKSGSGSGHFDKSVGKQKMVLKDGNVVDPDCEVADITHIYKDGKDVYNAVLSNVDLAKNKNSYYKIQLLKHDKKENQYYVFRSWGRVGTTIGGTLLDKFKNKEDAIAFFEQYFQEKTKNEWNRRKKFKKFPNCYYPVDIDYGGDTQMATLDTEKSNSSLHKSIQDLICMIFDVQKMKEQMLEFELDLEKMPLGKLSKKQLLKACSVLKELSQLIESKPLNATKVKDATNRFYTLIPHNFGTERPTLIDSEDMIKSKMDMLEALLDIEMAYEMINSNDEETKNMDPIDHHYHKLNATIHPLSKDEEEFSIIEKYLKNTHGSTHNFSLEIEDVFKVERHGEAERYLQKYKDFENRMLLWHGSRVTNFAGILSQGLRIAPPEAPVTGYMFGKGIYFADMVTKSAGYCHHNSNKNVGLLLLSEVAVGQTWELFDAKDVKKLPKDKHSVKGVGKTTPDPNEIHVMPDGVKVPLGKGVDKEADKCSLLYNEYIVYDVNQIRVKYLLKCKFNTKSLF